MNRTTALHASSVALTGVFVLLALGSGKPKTTVEGGTVVASATATATGPAKPATPKDADRAAIDKELGCAGAAAKTDLCRVWTDFGAATETFTPPSSGMTTWVGKSFAQGGPKPGYAEYVFVQVVGESTAAPPGIADSDVLGANMVLRTYDPKENNNGTGDADALLAALKAGKKPPAFNLFAMHTEFKVYTQSPDAIVRTAGPSVGFADKGGVVGWLRKSGNRLLAVEFEPSRNSDHETRGGLSTQTKSTPAKVWCTEAWLLKDK